MGLRDRNLLRGDLRLLGLGDLLRRGLGDFRRGLRERLFDLDRDFRVPPDFRSAGEDDFLFAGDREILDLFRLEETNRFLEADRDFALDSFADCERDFEAFFFEVDREIDFFFREEFDRDLDFPSFGDFDLDSAFDFDGDRESDPSFPSFLEDCDRSAVFFGEGDRD
jgi:hypothetical protein